MAYKNCSKSYRCGGGWVQWADGPTEEILVARNNLKVRGVSTMIRKISCGMHRLFVKSSYTGS